MKPMWIVTEVSGTTHEIDARAGQRIYFQDHDGKRHFLGAVRKIDECILRRPDTSEVEA